MTELLPGVHRKNLSYKEYRRHALDCDVLLWEPTGFYGKAVARGTGGPFSHASLVMWLADNLWDVGFDEKSGGAGRPLRGQVRLNPGKISVFRLPEDFNRDEMRKSFIAAMSETPQYNWGGILLIVLTMLLGIRFLPGVQEWLHKRIQQHGLFCSQSIHSRAVFSNHAYLCRLPSWKVTPNDLGQSTALTYLGTLV